MEKYILKIKDTTFKNENICVSLSRKGWDSSNGCRPNLIVSELKEKKFYMLPIPYKDDKLKWGDLTKVISFYGKDGVEQSTIYEIIQHLKPKVIKTVNKKSIKEVYDTCHLDPDLSYDNTKRESKWVAMYGQDGGFQSHLETNMFIKDGKVQDGSLCIFIFFGLYKELTKVGSLYKYTGKETHNIFGYLVVDRLIYPAKDLSFDDAELIKNHPHKTAPKYEEEPEKNNCIYVACQEININGKKLKGGGMFKYDEELTLTKYGHSCSRWKPAFFGNGLKMTYHNQPWGNNKFFKSANQGQEFVFKNRTSKDKNDDKVYEEAINKVLELIYKYGEEIL